MIENSRVGGAVWLLLMVVYGCYEGSALARFVRGSSACLCGHWRTSRIGRFLQREGAISRGWRHSIFSLFLSVVINLPGLFCRAVYRRQKPALDGSAAVRLILGTAEEAPIAAAWLMLLVLVIPYEHWNNAYSLMGFSLLLLCAVLASCRKPQQRLDTVGIGPYLVAFAGFVIAAWVLSISSMESQRYLMYHLSCMLCLLVIVSTVERADQLARLAGMASLGLLVISAYAFVQRMQGVEIVASYVDLSLNKNMPGRVFSFFENPNAFGEVLVLLIPLAAALVFGARSLGGRLLGLISLLSGGVALIMTYSRAGWVGLLIAAIVFVFLWKRKLLPLFLALGLAAVPFLPDVVLNRIVTIFNMKDSSTSSRFPLYEGAWNLIREHPLWGAGLGSDAVRMAVKQGGHYHGVAPFVHSHNVYLQVWAEMGILALLSLLASVGWAWKRAARVALRALGSARVRLIVIGGISAIAGIMVCGIADYIWHYPRVMLIFWFVFSVTLAGIRLALREERSAEAAAPGTLPDAAKPNRNRHRTGAGRGGRRISQERGGEYET